MLSESDLYVCLSFLWLKPPFTKIKFLTNSLENSNWGKNTNAELSDLKSKSALIWKSKPFLLNEAAGLNESDW